MAYRRKQGIQRSATFVEDHRHGGSPSSPAAASPRATRFADDNRRPERPSTLASRAVMASSAAALRDPLPAFADRRLPASSASLGDGQPGSPTIDPVTQLYTSTRSLNDDGTKYDLELSKKDDAKHGFWGVLAQKAKVMLDENGTPRQSQPSQSRWSYDRVRNSESPTAQRASEARVLDIGGKIKNVLEQEGLTVAESTTPVAGAGNPQVRRLQIRRKACSMDMRGANMSLASPVDMSPVLGDPESPQIKASRDVANAMAAKVKLLQRELKTVKADLAFSKERCAQLEEENRLLRGGNQDADEDLIRQQLETLLGEKARLANENTVYARENRFLREIVEYHQLNMQDVVNLDDGIEEEDEEEAEADADEDAGPETEQNDDDLRTSSPSRHAQEQEEAERPPACPGTAPQSPSRHTDEVRMLSSNTGGAVEAESPVRRSSNDEGWSQEATSDG
ncbi:hypothetical protein ACP70R_034185 [Stipagrostis hirtigluma subsp. patula]